MAFEIPIPASRIQRHQQLLQAGQAGLLRDNTLIGGNRRFHYIGKIDLSAVEAAIFSRVSPSLPANPPVPARLPDM